MKDLMRGVNDYLKRHEAIVVVSILKKIGPGPGKVGKKILVKEDLSQLGSFGGGLIDAKIIQIAANVFKTRIDQIEVFSFAGNTNNRAEMNGGKIELLYEYCDSIDQETGIFYDRVNALFQEKKDFLVITEIPYQNYFNKKKWICTETGFYGRENDQIHQELVELRQNFSDYKYKEAFIYKDNYFVEPFFFNEKVIIFGAGYMGQLLSELCKLLNFYVIIVDDQGEFAKRERFEKADEIMVIPFYESIKEYLVIDDQSYVLIMTRGHINDQEILWQILQTPAKYIGMIGSRLKRNRIFQKLLETGLTYEELSRVHCPVGLKINGETPEEIAISIAGELVQFRRGGLD